MSAEQNLVPHSSWRRRIGARAPFAAVRNWLCPDAIARPMGGACALLAATCVTSGLWLDSLWGGGLFMCAFPLMACALAALGPRAATTPHFETEHGRDTAKNLVVGVGLIAALCLLMGSTFGHSFGHGILGALVAGGIVLPLTERGAKGMKKLTVFSDVSGPKAAPTQGTTTPTARLGRAAAAAPVDWDRLRSVYGSDAVRDWQRLCPDAPDAAAPQEAQELLGSPHAAAHPSEAPLVQAVALGPTEEPAIDWSALATAHGARAAAVWRRLWEACDHPALPPGLLDDTRAAIARRLNVLATVSIESRHTSNARFWPQAEPRLRAAVTKAPVLGPVSAALIETLLVCPETAAATGLGLMALVKDIEAAADLCQSDEGMRAIVRWHASAWVDTVRAAAPSLAEPIADLVVVAPPQPSDEEARVPAEPSLPSTERLAARRPRSPLPEPTPRP